MVLRSAKPAVWRTLSESIDAHNAALSKENFDKRILGFFAERNYIREYPSGSLVSSLVGFVRQDGIGATGLESSMNSLISGTDGRYSYARGLGAEIPGSQNEIISAQKGTTVRLTIDRDVQWVAANAIQEAVSKARAVSGTVIVMDPKTGQILAHATAPTFDPNNTKSVSPSLMRNPSVQDVYEPGSTGKIMTLAAALEAGIPLTSMWNGDSPQIFDDLGKPYEVSNYGDEGWGQTDLINATKHSINTVYVPLGQKAGLDKVVDVARRAGIPESVAMVPAPSVTLGVASPHVIDVASAYATFAAQGIFSKPYLIASVTGPNKGLLYEGQTQTQEVFTKDVMADLTYALKSVVNGGTGSAALALGRPAAGKTGTSQSNASAWFSGYTPQLAASVALFRDSASESLNGIGGLTSVTGGTFPAKIWTAFMKGALKGEPIMSFPAPANVGGLDPVVMTSGGTQTIKEK